MVSDTDGLRRAWSIDAALYLASAGVSLALALTASIAIQREWAWMAVGPYALGALTAMALRRRPARARAALAAALFVAVAVVPTLVEVGWRGATRPGLHVQSEVLLTEEGARALVRGQDPYRAPFDHGPLAPWPAQTRHHLPYPPVVLVFGLPAALFGRNPATDPRVWLALASVVTAAGALRRWRAPPARRLRAAQFLLVLPTGALLMPTSGKDLPVLASILLSLVLLEEGRARASGLSLGVAAGLKQLAGAPFPFLVRSPVDRSGRRMGVWPLGTAVAAVAVTVLPFLVWSPSAFVEDVIRFPLGFGQPRPNHPSPTPGVLLTRALPGWRNAVAVAALAVALGLTVWLVARAPRPTAAQVAIGAGLVLLAAMLLAPGARLGDLVFPVDLLVWGRLLRPARPGRLERKETPEPAPQETRLST